MPEVSSYPIIDFALKTHYRTTAAEAEVLSALHLSASDKAIREALKHEYTITRSAKHDPSRHSSTTSPENESDSESQQVLLEDEDVEMRVMPALGDEPAPYIIVAAQIRRKPLFPSHVPGLKGS
jgi:hypothetical protein